MKTQNAPAPKSVLRLTLEQKTLNYWHMAYAYNHPKAPGVSCETMIKTLGSIEEQTAGHRALKRRATRLLDSVIGIPNSGPDSGGKPPNAA